MAPAELKVLKRLSTRCNILPVIARADTLTDERLTTIKSVVRRDLALAGLGFGIFEPASAAGAVVTTVTTSTEVKTPQRKPSRRVHIQGEEDEEEAVEDEEDDRPARPVIKLKSPRAPALRERSRSRRRMLDLDDEDDVASAPQTPHAQPGAAWPAQPKSALASILPFAFISPEESPVSSNKEKKSKDTTQVVDTATDPAAGVDAASSAGDPQSRRTSVATSVAGGGRRPSIRSARAAIRGPADLQGKFVRKYRWGTIDVLDPAHCDFVALRAAVLGSQMRSLKKNTKEVLYEKFRTEKLLARRATSAFSDADRTKMLSELGV